ncbi:hypothetical protein [Silvanigrella aquatica]|uniref:Lipoprotein n=1 Tax=Silvanigrella aquatica TaxID=1915309 RepID=A0A1L4CXI5_9BACT|nr:hypothetical protein [Silvanigrella aquatica]APJ02660.1 hypothetical protein AXG55_01415 [Silvanigrella aquatica]
MLKKNLLIAVMSVACTAVYSCKDNNKNTPKVSQDSKKKSVLTASFSGVTGTPVDTPFEVNGNVTCGTAELPPFKLSNAALNIEYFSNLRCNIKITSIMMDTKTYTAEEGKPLTLNIVDNKIVSSAENVKFTYAEEEIYFNAETANGASAIYHMTAEVGKGRSLTDAKAAALTPNQIPNSNVNRKAPTGAPRQTLPFSVKKLFKMNATVNSTSSFEVKHYADNIFAVKSIGTLNLATHCRVLPFVNDTGSSPTQEQLNAIFNTGKPCSEKIMSDESFKPFYDLSKDSYLIVTLEGTNYFPHKMLRNVTQADVDAANALLIPEARLAKAVASAQQELDTAIENLGDKTLDSHADEFTELNNEKTAKEQELSRAQSELQTAQQTAQELQAALEELNANTPPETV